MQKIKVNYGKMLTDELKEFEAQGKKPKLLLHCCCAPCSSYVLEYLNNHLQITPYFYNPNISPESEYDYRFAELERLTKEMPLNTVFDPIKETYDNYNFESAIIGLQNKKEGGARCKKCYELRLMKTAEYAKEQGFDYICTTLSISPLKNADWLNEIGKKAAEKYGVNYLFSDFKKNEGYKRSIVLSKQYSLYRQNYCGCKYSKQDK